MKKTVAKFFYKTHFKYFVAGLFRSGLKVGRMTRTVHMWVTFLMGQVGLIYKLNYLDVTWNFWYISSTN